MLASEISLEDIIKTKMLDYNNDHGIIDTSIKLSTEKKETLEAADAAFKKRIEAVRNIYRSGDSAGIHMLRLQGITQPKLESMSDDQIISLIHQFDPSQSSTIGQLQVEITRDGETTKKKKKKKKKKSKKRKHIPGDVHMSDIKDLVDSPETTLGQGEYIPILSLFTDGPRITTTTIDENLDERGVLERLKESTDDSTDYWY